MLSPELKKCVLSAQRDEITEYHVYQKLAALVKDKAHAEIFEKLAREEWAHYELFKSLTQEDVQPDQGKIFWHVLSARVLGLNFGLRLMENDEHFAQDVYAQLKTVSPRIEEIIREEQKHEHAMLDMIDEDRLKYVSSVILGLNDALIELTGSLAGFTLAVQNARLIGVLGLITGTAAAMSMAVSEYLSTRGEDTQKDPVRASLYTGLSYIATVVVLVLPYFFFNNIFACLAIAVTCSLVVILIFTFYISVAKNLDFKKRFIEMAVLSLSIAVITFFIGLAARKAFGVDV